MVALRDWLRQGFDVAIAGSDPAFAEPGSGASIDAARAIVRLAPWDPALRDRFGSRAGEACGDPLAELLARLATQPSQTAFLCGFDPTPHREAIERGVEGGAFALAGALHRALGTPVPNHGLPATYRCNPVAYFDDTGHTDEWQREVYELARELADARGFRRIVDLGCGSGYKLVHWFPSPAFRTLGIDLPATVQFLAGKYPDRDWMALDIERQDMLTVCADLIIASDVIEHLRDPDVLLGFLARCRAHAIVLSTPDAHTLVARSQRDPGGPPRNTHHVREWTQREFARYVSGSLEVVHQELHLPNATQIAVCRPAERPAPGPARARRSEPDPLAAHIALPAERPCRERSRTRELEQQLRVLACERVSIALVPGLEVEPDPARREGFTVFAPAAAREWSPLDGMLGAECSRGALLAALAAERGPHGPERALLRMADAEPQRHVQRASLELTPGAFLAQLDALLALHAAGARWPDPRPLLGPAVRAAIARAESTAPALAADLAGLWAAHTGAAATRERAGADLKTSPSAPELEVPIDPGAAWLLVAPDAPGGLDAALAHASSDSKTPLHLLLPWAAALPIAAFANRVVELLSAAGLDPDAIAPLVVLERPLFAAEIAWIAEAFPRWDPPREGVSRPAFARSSDRIRIQ